MKDQIFHQVNPDYARDRSWIVSLVCLSVVAVPEGAIAHGVKMQYQTMQSIAVQANYDTGSPLANAQVTVYAPDSDTPWGKGTTDAQGKFIFTPDPMKAGTWQVKARLAGHGDVINIAVGESGAATISANASEIGYNPLQKGVMVASVIWGAVGTALFFLGRKR